MGFFSDLKDDLSQAVNELMTEEELEAALAGEGTSEKKDAAQGAPVTSEELSDMLDMVEAISAENGLFDEEPEAVAEPETVIGPEAVTEPEAMDLPLMEALEEELPVQEPQTETPEASLDAMMAEAALEEPVMEQPVTEEAAAAAFAFETEAAMPQEEAVAESIVEGITEPEEEVVLPKEPEAEGVYEEVIEENEKLPEEVMPEEIKEEPVVEETEAPEERKGEEKKMDNQPTVMSDETAVVTEGMSITGDIVSAGSLELIGTVTGNIEVLGKLNITGAIQGNSKAAEIFAEGARINGEISSQGSVKIGQSSVVIGNISANSAVIAGAVKGDIDVHGPVVLDTSAIVMGNIKSKSVQINNGAVIEGMCSQCYADVNPTSFFEEIKKKKEK
ncbi:MAG: polymer-forming cytoskeletal protein [Muribaculaceae bacterium]|nr:polymer-forming cytoskeletal protein [Muribaculaceae bacterium]